METTTKKSNTIILIHGMFLNNKSWLNWKEYFEEKGYKVFIPSYPGHEGEPRELRNKIHPDLTKTGLKEVLDAMSVFVNSLPEKPIVIGHSMGGLIVQKLVDLDKVAAGICIDGAPPKNVMAPFSAIKAGWAVLNPFKSNASPYFGSRNWYRKYFFNTMSEFESDKMYEKYSVPESRRILRDSISKAFAKIDFEEPHNPLLFISGEKDAFFSPSFTKKISQQYTHKPSKVEFKVFENRSHFICGEEKWEEVAKFASDWLNDL